MSKGKRKSKRKPKPKIEDLSKIIDSVDEQQSEESEEVTNAEHFREQESENSVPCGNEQQMSKSKRRRNKKSSKQVHIAFLPEKYQPLVEDQIDNLKNEETAKKQPDKYKTFRKNVGKALRFSWKCLVAGLQSFTTAYSMPLSAATILVPPIHRPKPTA